MCSNKARYVKKSPSAYTLEILSSYVKKFMRGEKVFSDDYRDVFSLTGGEPTLNSELLSIMQMLKQVSPDSKINLLTNGRMLSYPSFAKQLYRLGFNFDLTIPLHGHNALLHDSITRTPGSFAQTLSGIRNILKFKKPADRVEIRIVIHRLNYTSLSRITKFINSAMGKIDRLVYIFFEIEGLACINYSKLKLTYSRLRPYINDVCGFLSLFPDVRFYHFPLCVVPREIFPHVWRSLPAYEVTFPKKCFGCVLKNACLGIHKGYLRFEGSQEFKPIVDKKGLTFGRSWHHPIVSNIIIE